MQLSITFRHFPASEALKEYAREKVERVNKYLDRAGEAHVVLSLERHLCSADIRIHSGHYLLRGTDKSEDLYASIDLAMDRIERQLRRHKERLKCHHDRNYAHHQARALQHLRVRHEVLSYAEPDPPRVAGRDAGPPAEALSPRVIRTNEFLARPMTVDEAVMQMDLMNNEFLVFTNLQSRELNVVYRRKDGHYGLIEAHAAQAAEQAKVA